MNFASTILNQSASAGAMFYTFRANGSRFAGIKIAMPGQHCCSKTLFAPALAQKQHALLFNKLAARKPIALNALSYLGFYRASQAPLHYAQEKIR